MNVFFPSYCAKVANYRQDVYAHVQNIGGLAYKECSENGIGRYGLFKTQAYGGIKIHFFARASSDGRHSMDHRVDPKRQKSATNAKKQILLRPFTNKSNHSIFVVEAKSEKCKKQSMDDIVKMARYMKDTLDCIEDDGYGQVTVCGLISSGVTCSIYAMQHN